MTLFSLPIWPGLDTSDRLEARRRESLKTAEDMRRRMKELADMTEQSSRQWEIRPSSDIDGGGKQETPASGSIWSYTRVPAPDEAKDVPSGK